MIGVIAIVSLIAVCVFAAVGPLMPKQQEDLLEFVLLITLVALLAVCGIASVDELIRR